MGRGSFTLGYSSSFSDVYSIDIYPLRLALEYGLVGFMVYYFLIFSVLRYSAAPLLNSDKTDNERMLFVPIGVGVLSFVLMQFFFAMEDNQGVLYVLFGILAGLTYRYRRAPVAEAAPARARKA